MRTNTRRTAAGLALIVGFLLAGCSGSGGTKPNARVREVDTATNVVNTTTKADTAAVLVNGGASDVAAPYGAATRYLFVEAGTSAFQGTTTMTLPTITQTPAGSTTPTTTTVPPPIDNVNLIDGGRYTGYLIGRPDVPNPTKPDLSDLDPRYLKCVVLQDNQAAPTAGMATVRVINGACDAGNVDVLVNGIVIYGFVPFATQAIPASADQPLTAGTVSVSVNVAGTSTVLVPATPVTLVAGGTYTLVVTEPTAVTQAGVVPPNPPATATTYGLQLVGD